VCGVKSERRATALAMGTSSISNVYSACLWCGVLYSRFDMRARFSFGVVFSLQHFLSLWVMCYDFVVCCAVCACAGLLIAPQRNVVIRFPFFVLLLRSLLPLYHFRFVSSASLLFFFCLSALLCRLRLSNPPILSKLSALPVGSAHVPRWPDKWNGGGVLSVNNPNHQVVICK